MGEATALEVIDIVSDLTSQMILLRRGNVYPALRGLQGEGLVKSRSKHSAMTGRDRDLWSLTPKGKKIAAIHKKAMAALYAA